MKSVIYSLLSLLMLLSLSGCIDEIDLDIDNDSQFVIVNGLVSDVLDSVQVKLDYSPVIGVGNDNILTPISGAQVTLTGSDGSNVVYIEDDSKAGIYRAYTSATPGVSYQIDIITPDGQSISSAPAIAPDAKVADFELDYDVASVDNFNAEGNIVTTEFVDIFVSLDLSGPDRPFLRWRLDGEYEFLEQGRMLLNPRTCYIKETTDFNNIAIANTEEIATDVLEGKQIYRTVMNERFNLLYCYHVLQYSLTEEEYTYWQNIEQLVNIDGTLFDPPPGSIVSNLVDNNGEGRVQGYFSVVGLESKRVFVDVTQRGAFAPSECRDGFAGRNNAPKCSNCPSIRGSSLTRPTYWIP